MIAIKILAAVVTVAIAIYTIREVRKDEHEKTMEELK